MAIGNLPSNISGKVFELYVKRMSIMCWIKKKTYFELEGRCLFICTAGLPFVWKEESQGLFRSGYSGYEGKDKEFQISIELRTTIKIYTCSNYSLLSC